MLYKEEDLAGNKYREEYLKSIYDMLTNMQNKADETRSLYFNKMKGNNEAYRTELKKMLGWPLTDYNHDIPNAKTELVTKEESVSIYRITIELPIGIKFYGMFFEHNDKSVLPLVITQHGGLGTPELCSGILECGSMNYNDMVMRIFNKGVNVFAPQLLLWDKDKFKMENKRTDVDSKLKQLGSSISAVEIYAIIKSIDYLSSLKCVDEQRIGMAGLSYGGFYTLFTSAIDTRIKAAIACSQYNNRYKYSWTDWSWFNSANKFMDNEVAYLVYPRKLIILVGNNDELFDCDLAEREFSKLKNMLSDNEWLDFYAFEGCHEFIKEDIYIDKFIDAL